VWSLAEKRAKARPDGHCSAPTPGSEIRPARKVPDLYSACPAAGLRACAVSTRRLRLNTRTRGARSRAGIRTGLSSLWAAPRSGLRITGKSRGLRAVWAPVPCTTSSSAHGRDGPPHRCPGPHSGDTRPAVPDRDRGRCQRHRLPPRRGRPEPCGEGAGDLLGAGGATHRDAAPGPAGAGGPAACGPPRQGQGRQGPGGAAGPGAPPRGHPRPDPVGRTVPQALRGPGNSHGDRGHSRGLPSRASAAPVG